MDCSSRSRVGKLRYPRQKCGVHMESSTGNARLTQCTWNSGDISNTGPVDLSNPAPMYTVDGKDMLEVLSCSEVKTLAPVEEDTVAAKSSSMSTHTIEDEEDLRRIYAVTVCLTDCP
jgi:hypothetical protein